MHCGVSNSKIVEILMGLHDIFIKVFDHDYFDLSYFILLENLHMFFFNYLEYVIVHNCS